MGGDNHNAFGTIDPLGRVFQIALPLEHVHDAVLRLDSIPMSFQP